MYKQYRSVMTELVHVDENHSRLAPFVMELCHNGHNEQDILEFFEYWSFFSTECGVWMGETTYSYDCPPEEPEEGLLFDIDNVDGQFVDFINYLQVEHLRRKIERLTTRKIRL